MCTLGKYVPNDIHCFLADPGGWGCIFLLDLSSCYLCMWSSPCFIWNLFWCFVFLVKILFCVQVFVWPFSLIFWSDYFNQSCLKMPLARFFSNRNYFSEMAHFFRLQPIPSGWDILLNLAEKALCLVPLGSSCFLRISWYSGLHTT